MSTVNDYAENSHDPLCVKYISGDDLPCICDLLAEHAQIIRADERHFLHSRGLRSVALVEQQQNDLRAQVKALRHEDECDVSRGRERPETGMAECNCLRADVLALLGGESE